MLLFFYCFKFSFNHNVFIIKRFNSDFMPTWFCLPANFPSPYNKAIFVRFPFSKPFCYTPS